MAVRLGTASAIALALAVTAGQAWAVTGPLSSRDERVLEKAFAALGDGRVAEQTDSANAAAAQVTDPVLREVLNGFAVAAGGNVHEAIGFARAHPDWPRMMDLRIRIDLKAAEATDAEALAWFGEHEPVTMFGIVRYAAALRTKGDDAAGAAMIEKAWTRVSLAQDTTVLMMAKFPDLALGGREARMAAMADMRRWDEAESLLPYMGTHASLLLEARRAFVEDRPNADFVLGLLPATVRADRGLLLDRAAWHRRNGRPDEAAALIEALPPSEEDRVWAERRDTARALAAMGKAQRAYDLVVGAGLQRGWKAAQKATLAGWLAYDGLHDAALAISWFDKAAAASRAPAVQAFAAYWTAVARQDLGDNPGMKAATLLAASFSSTLHGQAALRIIAQSEDAETQAAALARGTAPVDPAPSAEATTRLEQRFAVKAAHRLHQIGRWDLRDEFLRSAANTIEDPAELALLAGMAKCMGADRVVPGIETAANALGAELGASALVGIGRPEGVRDPLLLGAAAQAASGLDANYDDGKGRRGLLGLTKGEADEAGSRLNLTGDARLDPTTALRLGGARLDDMVGRYGDETLALAAFRAGAPKTDAWLAAIGDPRKDIDPLSWAERIPDMGVRGFVKEAMRVAALHRRAAGPN